MNFSQTASIMKKNLTLLFLLTFLAFALNVQAQGGQSDVRFVQGDVTCPEGPIDFIIEVKATSPDKEFFMSEQNYRFSFNRAALENPRITEELTISSFIGGDDLPLPRTNLGFTLFSPHNLTGSLDTVVSYNVELAGGDGYYLRSGEDDWVQVGRIEFDVLSADACFDLEWHPQSLFPPTFVGEVYTDENGLDARSNTDESFYGQYANCMPSLCLGVELVNFRGEERDCRNQLTWETATESNSAYFILERSFNADEFIEIGRVSAAGVSYENRSYDFTDQWAGAEMYYRLKLVDADGSYNYSNLVKIESECHAGDTGTFIDVFPNPIVGNSEAFIKLFVDTDEDVYIDVIDVRGALVSETQVGVSNGPNLLPFPTNDLASGTYFIRVRGNGWFSAASKFIKLGISQE